MNLANKLTLLRVILIPIFVFFLLWQFTSFNVLISLLIFAIASVTDALDGNYARKHNLVTDFGKFLDPLADKALVMAALLAFVELGWTGSVPVMIILFREFMVSALRLVAQNSTGKVIAAGWLGKLKTAFTMIAIIVILFAQGVMATGLLLPADAVMVVSDILIWIATVLTAVSGIQYLMSYWDVIDTNK